MLTLDPSALPMIREHLVLPRPLGDFVAALAPHVGGGEGAELAATLLEIDWRRFRARTAWADATERAAAKVHRIAPTGPCSRRQQRRRTRLRRSIERARLQLDQGRVLDVCRFGDLAVEEADLALCPRTTLATSLLPFLFPGGPHLTEGGWVVGWRAQLLRRARNPVLLARWYAPDRIRRALTDQERGRWLGRLAVRLADVGRLWERVDQTWRLPHAFERALRGWIGACDAEGAGDLLDRFCPAPVYGHRLGAFARAPDPIAVVVGRARCGRRELAALRVSDTLREWVPTQVPTRSKSPEWWEGLESTPQLPKVLHRAR